MNMKKTIAAVAACAVAVSAMATTVSAEENTINYNLVKTTYKTSVGTVKYRATISGETLSGSDNYLVIKFDGANSKYIDSSTLNNNIYWTVTGYTTDANKVKTDTFSYVNYVPKQYNWIANSSDLVQYNWSEDTLFAIPLGTNGVQAVANGLVYATVEITVGHSASWYDADLAKGTFTYGFDPKTTSITYDSKNNANEYAALSAAATTPLIAATSDVTGATTTEDGKYPLKTSYNTTSTAYGTPEIIEYLGKASNNLVAENLSYVNVIPVLNDIIAAHDDVTFTFNTATQAVDSEGKYSSSGDSQYTVFGQHLYNLYGDETTGYIYSTAYDFNGFNLFSGALIVNGAYSMQLSDTTVFDYGATSLSFNWDDVTSNGNVNSYATYLQKLQLATSTTWYWDSLDVTYADTEADDIGAGEGAEADEDEIDEDEDEDVVADEDEDVDVDEDEDVDVEEEEEEDVDVEEEEEAPAAAEEVATSNPSTGNAPIALAVIPVALAAAAVVAKKRG